MQEKSDNFKQNNNTDSIEEDIPANRDPRLFIKKKANERRAEMAKRSYERKRHRWFQKVENTVKSYRSTLDVLSRECEKGMITSVLFALGISPLTPKCAIKVVLPNQEALCYMSNTSTQSIEPSMKKKVLYTLFKVFAGSADISAFTNSYFSSSKIWTLFEKVIHVPDGACSDYNSSCEANVIVRRDYQITPRAKVIEVHLNGIKPRSSVTNIDMDLTPCVSVCRNHLLPVVKRNTSSVGLFTTPSSVEVVEGDDLGLCPLDFSVDEDTSGNKETLFLAPLPSPHKRVCLTGFTETPQRFKNCDPMVETPVVSKHISTPSPVKRLVKRISMCQVTPKSVLKKEKLWYQVEQSINGLKDVYLKETS